MDRIEVLVDRVIAAFDARRRKGFSMTGAAFVESREELRPWRERIDARVHQFRHWSVDRPALLDRCRHRFSGNEWASNFEAVADELQNMARDELCRHLADNGMPAETARQVAE